MFLGVNQSKFIQERLINEQSSILTSVQLEEYVSSLNRAYQMVNVTIDNLVKQVEQSMAKTKLVFLPFNGSSILKATEKEAACMLPKMGMGTSFQVPEYELHAPQVASAHHLLSCVLSSKDGAPSYDLRHFSSVEFALVIPPSQSYFHQVLHQVEMSNVLVELGLGPPTQSKDAGFSTDHVIQYVWPSLNRRVVGEWELVRVEKREFVWEFSQLSFSAQTKIRVAWELASESLYESFLNSHFLIKRK